MTFKLTFELDGLPRMTNMPSGPSHWIIKKKEADKWKGLVVQAVRAAGSPPILLPVETAKLRLTRCSTVRPDTDGLVSGFKHVIDGLVLAGVITNDRFQNIGFPEYLHEKAKQGQGKIRVEVFINEPTQGVLDV